MNKTISPSELNNRIAVIKRFKELLQAQRDRFQTYLHALDKQKDVIEKGTTEELLQYVEMEERIVTDIFSIQKVIDPLEKMYQAAKVDTPPKSSSRSEELHSGGGEVASLKKALDGLKTEAVFRSERNRELLSKRMAELRSEIKTLKSNYPMRRPDSSQTPSFIDLKG